MCKKQKRWFVMCDPADLEHKQVCQREPFLLNTEKYPLMDARLSSIFMNTIRPTHYFKKKTAIG